MRAEAGHQSSVISPVVAITGVGGYVGSSLAQDFVGRGWSVWGLSRGTRSGAHWQKTIPYDLASEPEPARLSGADALVHCAYDFAPVSRDVNKRINVDGSVGLLRAARAAGVPRIVFISTMSAFEGCVSMYGQAKLEIERAALSMGAAVVRPGLVYGRGAAGMIGALDGILRISPVLPVFGDGRQVLYLAHVEDLSALVAMLCTAPEVPTQPVIAASEAGMTFKEILAALANRRGRRPLFLPFPWRIAWLALKAAESAGLRPRTKSDSLVSLLNQNPSPDFGPTRRLGAPFRDFRTWNGE